MSSAANESIATRETLLNRLKDCEDHSGWQRFYDTYRDLIFSFALKAGLSEQEAEEVVQETAVGVARKLPEFKYDPAVCSFKTWLLNQTVWRIKSQFRKRLPAAPHGVPRAENGERTGTIERIADPTFENWEARWESDWRTAVLTEALRRLKSEANLRDCQMFELYVIRQWPPREVARALNVSVARVYLAKHRLAPLAKTQIAQLESESI